jgi:hypothetical protein
MKGGQKLRTKKIGDLLVTSDGRKIPIDKIEIEPRETSLRLKDYLTIDLILEMMVGGV